MCFFISKDYIQGISYKCRKKNIRHTEPCILPTVLQGDPREPDIFKINSTQLFFK